MQIKYKTSLKVCANLWSPDEKPMPTSMCVITVYDHEVCIDGRKISEGISSHRLSFLEWRDDLQLLVQKAMLSVKPSVLSQLNHDRCMDPVKHNAVVYTDWMFCLQVTEGEDIKCLIFHITGIEQ